MNEDITSPKKALRYKDIKWKEAHAEILQFQRRIAVAYKNNPGEMLLLQEQFVRTFAARAMAVRRVTENSGGRTPGVDGVLWKTDEDKMQAITSLRDLSNYRASPVRRVMIPKTQGGERPLGIPTMIDRGVQTLWMMALLPIAECTADSRSYGFRPKHSTKDAMVYVAILLMQIYNPRRWILEADIEKFFDRIDHNWLLKHIPMNKRILKEFLKAGALLPTKERLETPEGTPQGGPISPMIANMALDGLQNLLTEAGFIMCRYADDFVVLGRTKEELESQAKQLINEFLAERGLRLSPQKTLTTWIQDGFQFLGYHFQEYPDPKRAAGTKQGIFLVTPPKSRVIRFKQKCKDIINSHSQLATRLLIKELNPILRGWAEYYRNVSSSRVFTAIGKYVFERIARMLIKRYRKVPARELLRKHFKTVGENRWVFFSKDEKGREITLYQMGYTIIKRHTLRPPVNPYLPDESGQFPALHPTKPSLSLNKRQEALYKMQKGICPHCGMDLNNDESLEVNHKVAVRDGGKDQPRNLELLHHACHKQVTNLQNIARTENKNKAALQTRGINPPLKVA